MPRRPRLIPPVRFGRCFAATAAALSLTGCSGNGTRRDFAGQQPLPRSTGDSAVPSSFSSPRDDLDRPVTLKSPARRVLVLGPGAVETIFSLGAGERIVGRDSGADFPESIKKVATVADFNGLFIEACIAQRPDLILVQGETWGRERVEGWQKKIGAPVAALVPTTVNDVQKDADKIASWLGVKRRSLQFGDYAAPSSSSTLPPNDRVEVLEGAVPRHTAFIEIQRSPLWTAGQNTLVADVVRSGGFRSVASDVVGYKAFSKEALLQRQPDFYIATGKPTDKARIISELRRDAALSGLKCVRAGQVLVVPDSFLLRPGPRLKDGLKLLRAAASEAETRQGSANSPVDQDARDAQERRQKAFDAEMRRTPTP